MAVLDAARNFVKATLAAGISAGATSVSLVSNGSRFSHFPFNATIWNFTDYSDAADDPNAEIVRITNQVSNTLAILRAQEGTSAVAHNTVGKTYLIDAGPTAKLITDIPALLATSPAIDVTADPYNALGDGIQLVDGVATASSTTFTSASATFVTEDVGKTMWIDGVGATGSFGNYPIGTPQRAPLVTTIASRVDAHTVTLAAPCQATLSSRRFVYASDDTVALQAAFAALGTAAGNWLVFPAGRIFVISGALTINRYGEDAIQLYGAAYWYNIKISGYGALLMCSTSNNFIQMTPNGAASVFVAPIIEGLAMEGIAAAGQTAIRLDWVFNGAIRDVKVRRVNRGFDLRGYLVGFIENCAVEYFMEYAYYLDTVDSIPCNVVTMDMCHAGPSSTALAAFYLNDTDMCVIRSGVSEGSWAGPSYVAEVVFTAPDLTQYARTLKIENFYSETNPVNTAIFQIVNNGSCVIEGLHRHIDPGGPIVSVVGSAASTVVFRNLKMIKPPMLPVTTWVLFRQNVANTVGWIFENMGEFATGETFDLSDAAHWVGGVVPEKLTQIEPGRIDIAGGDIGSFPTLVSAEIGAVDDSTIVATFSETVKAAAYTTGFSVSVNGSPATISSAARQVDTTVIHFVLSAPVAGSDMVKLSYSAADGFIENESGANLLTFVDTTVDNSGASYLLRDTFTDANGTLLTAHTMDVGPGWTDSSTPGAATPPTIQSNKVQTSGLDSTHAYIYISDAGVADCTVRIDAIFPNYAAIEDYVFLVLRAVDGQNCWIAGLTNIDMGGGVNDNFLLYNVVAGTPTLVDSAKVPITTDVPISITAVLSGTSIVITAGAETLNTTSSDYLTETLMGLYLVQPGAQPCKADAFATLV